MEVKEGNTDFLFQFRQKPGKNILSFTLYTYTGHPKLEMIQKIRSIEDLRKLNLLLVSNLGNGWFKTNIEDIGIRTHWVAGDEEILNFIALKQADATVDVAPSTDYLITIIGLADKLIKTEVTFGSSDFFIMISNKSPFASCIHEINRALNRIHKRDILQEVWAKYE